MATKRVTQLTAATLGRTDILLISKLSASVTHSAATISALASDNSYNDSASGFVAAGFAVNDQVNVAGFTGSGANNIFSGTITALTSAKMTIGGADGNVIVDDAAGETVVIKKWESQRATTLQASLVRGAVSALSIASGVVNIDYSLGDYFTLALTANVTSISFSNLPGSGYGASIMVDVTQDSTPRTVAWPAAFKWVGGAGAVSTASGAIDTLALTTFNNGTTWRATLAKAFT